MRSRNIQLGINGERFVFSLFERTMGKKRLEKGWYQVKHQLVITHKSSYAGSVEKLRQNQKTN